MDLPHRPENGKRPRDLEEGEPGRSSSRGFLLPASSASQPSKRHATAVDFPSQPSLPKRRIHLKEPGVLRGVVARLYYDAPASRLYFFVLQTIGSISQDASVVVIDGEAAHLPTLRGLLHENASVVISLAGAEAVEASFDMSATSALDRPARLHPAFLYTTGFDIWIADTSPSSILSTQTSWTHYNDIRTAAISGAPVPGFPSTGEHRSSRRPAASQPQLSGGRQVVFANTTGLQFRTVASLRQDKNEQSDVNVLGVVVDGSQAGKASGGQYVTVSLVDESVRPPNADAWLKGDWISVTFLNPDERFLPELERGDVVLIRAAKVVVWGKHTRLNIYPDKTCEWFVLPLKCSQNGNAFEAALRMPPDVAEPDAFELQQMHRLAAWSRAQLKVCRSTAQPDATHDQEEGEADDTFIAGTA